MRSTLLIFSFFVLGLVFGWFLKDFVKTNDLPLDATLNKIIERPLTKYSFENLAQADIKPGKIIIKDKINKEDEKYDSYLFEFEFNPNLDSKIYKKTTGQINIPLDTGSVPVSNLPIVLMFRGYIDQKTFKTGDGTRNAAKFFAENGYVTISPDFLGYGGSDSESGDIFETRFQTYVTAISLLKTLENNRSLEFENLKIEIGNFYIWGHSNGGQIAITLLEITGVNYPTTLWAPVTKPFPYSVLYYTDQSEDKGKFIRKELARFEQNYDVEKYSLDNYLDRINATITIHQGLKDDAIPTSWSEDFNIKLKSQDKSSYLHLYPNTDHNMKPMWDEVIERDLEFFKSNQDQ